VAEQNFLQRGLNGFRDTVRELRTGEGKGGAAAIGRGAKKAGKGIKAGLGKLRRTFGFSDKDTFNEDIDEQRRRRKARQFMGDDEPEYVGVRTQDPKRDLSTVAPEFRAQVSSGLAAANSMTTGSTLVDGGKDSGGSSGGGSSGGGDGRW
jgi:hypothetical protein